MQLFELLPHAARLVPVADRYFSSRTASEKANQTALAAMAEGVQADLGQVTKAHAGLYRKLQEQEVQLASMSEEVRQARTAMDEHKHQVEALVRQIKSLSQWVRLTVSVTTVLFLIILGLLLRK